jgi:hypothetical protein
MSGSLGRAAHSVERSAQIPESEFPIPAVVSRPATELPVLDVFTRRFDSMVTGTVALNPRVEGTCPKAAEPVLNAL